MSNISERTTLFLLTALAGVRPILEILFVVFIVLKLIGAISWSWWWVLSPFTIPLCFAVLVLVRTWYKLSKEEL